MGTSIRFRAAKAPLRKALVTSLPHGPRPWRGPPAHQNRCHHGSQKEFSGSAGLRVPPGI